MACAGWTACALTGPALAQQAQAAPPAAAVTAQADAPPDRPTPEPWNLHLQSTYIWQTKPALRSPYEGAHSLVGAHEKSYSFTATAALGVRLGPATELYVNPEVAQGVPLSRLQGLAGFTNGEMARTSGARPSLYRARLFVRHVVALSDDTEDVAPDMNQLGGQRATRRLTLTAGNLSVLDIFDANALAHDPRTQFLNWTVMAHGAYDFAADARGYTVGAAADYQGDGWALRAGRFAQPSEPNQLALDPHLGSHFGDQVELEKNYALGAGRPGTARLLAWRNRSVMARYADALALAATTGTAPDIDAARRGPQHKRGAGISLEQTLTPGIGAFARAMWADGQTETYAFTEVDRSLSWGAVATGDAWVRPADTVGLALAVNRLSTLHSQVLALGGTTFFLGDGRLRYAPERIAEAYYAWTPVAGLTLSLNAQRISNPGYNADRGPANFFALRVHVQH